MWCSVPKPTISQDKDHKTCPLPEEARGQKNSNASTQVLEFSKQRRTQVVEILIEIQGSDFKAFLPHRSHIYKTRGKKREFLHPMHIATLWIETPSWYKEWQVMVG